jgi:acyl carrier protein
MGLDGVEFIMAVEEAFQIAIPDEDGERMMTPGDVVTYVLGRVGSEQALGCMEQRAFYRLRRASIRVFRQPREAIRPTTRWDDILPKRQKRHNWRLLHQATGTPHWPRLTALGRVPDSVATIGDMARYLVTHGEGIFQRPTEGWSRQRIEATITRIMREVLGITEFRWDQEFVRDLGVD